MSDKVLIRQQLLRVYADGTTEMVDIPISVTPEATINFINNQNKYNDIEVSDDASQRIRICLGIINAIKNLDNTILSFDQKYSVAIQTLASKNKVKASTVIDKITRQMECNTKKVKKLICHYIEDGDMTIKEVLLNHIGEFSQEADIKEIKEFFK